MEKYQANLNFQYTINAPTEDEKKALCNVFLRRLAKQAFAEGFEAKAVVTEEDDEMPDTLYFPMAVKAESKAEAESEAMAWVSRTIPSVIPHGLQIKDMMPGSSNIQFFADLSY